MTTQGPITIYNKRLGADRRDLYYPTEISAASYAEKKGSSHSGSGETEEGLQYRLRIPQNAAVEGRRVFIPEKAYRDLSGPLTGFWTIAKLDLVTRGPKLVPGPATEREIREAADKAGIDVIIVEEYADNTDRGSPAVRHWRIGGR